MDFDIKHIRKQLADTPLVSPYPHDLSVAIICDTFRLANLRPPSRQDWTVLEQRDRGAGLWKEQVMMLAHLLTATELRATTAATLRPNMDATTLLQRFFTEVEPLTAEMIRSNVFRLEEFLRKWVHAVEGRVKDEAPQQSAARLKQLDYRTALQEMQRADEARKQEVERRKQELQEAALRATEARGWRE
ncbi:hypothetical protein LZ198_09495 [Myxococcus sp. K15C18031901]|uniref:hypothetical protein n=1 Tax=Myxococcus dinghuensis TaxID=2906761 RepID=UPI0020A7CA7C|nr:hypothetical protein [Myxococcus dinghuensis]MCP3099101.1 hypothetical protein [Myxococcus dinghuensis]